MSASRFAAAVVTVGLAVAVLTAPSGAASKTVRNGLIAYTVGNGEEDPYVIKTIRPNGTQNRTLLRPDRRFPGGPAGPRWSRDGKQLLFARYPDPNYDDPTVRSLWYSTASGKKIRRIPLGPRRITLAGYDWAPDGRRIVFAATRRGVPPTNPTMYTISIDGTHRRALGRGGYPSWSNDGRYILFSRNGIAVVRPNGTGFRNLTGSTHPDSSPNFSPDGKKVVFLRNAGTAQSEWRTVDVTGRNDVLIASHEPSSQYPQLHYCPPQWTPDGKRLAVVRAWLALSESMTPELVTAAPLAGARERVAFTFPGRYFGTDFNVFGTDNMCDFSWQPKR